MFGLLISGPYINWTWDKWLILWELLNNLGAKTEASLPSSQCRHSVAAVWDGEDVLLVSGYFVSHTALPWEAIRSCSRLPGSWSRNTSWVLLCVCLCPNYYKLSIQTNNAHPRRSSYSKARRQTIIQTVIMDVAEWVARILAQVGVRKVCLRGWQVSWACIQREEQSDKGLERTHEAEDSKSRGPDPQPAGPRHGASTLEGNPSTGHVKGGDTEETNPGVPMGLRSPGSIRLRSGYGGILGQHLSRRVTGTVDKYRHKILTHFNFFN